MKLGIPRSLLYFYYYPFWETLFGELGIEILLSDPDSKPILNNGVKNSISEICVPMKVYLGQVLDLLQQGADRIYVPRFVSIKKGITFCPKFLGLPDMLKHSLPGMEGRILTHHLVAQTDDISEFKNYRNFLQEPGITRWKLFRALKTARGEWQEFRRLQQSGYLTDRLLCGEQEKEKESGLLTIGLLGYVYNLYDNLINLDLLERLRAFGVKIVTFEMLPEEVINRELKPFRKQMFWEFTNKLLGAGYHFIHSPEYDGVIHLTAFGCGPDSILGPFLEFEAVEEGRPFMTLRIDEQTGEGHFLTRIEAFIDLLRLKIEKKEADQNRVIPG